ncbi:PiggyBac transposable element-derived protein [Lasallia pustulata]|uniref:PiggyBac transposable element-derived protein n=1 Tax=Lasallia pustulata TaxID=136370 RepID=A0A1W5CZI8_9LECA|nr:PiggyBac transposable element-derived protein [Lasallia pustulata]
MRVNEEEVQGVSDTLPPVVKSQLKRKQPIAEVLDDVPPCSSEFTPLHVPERSLKAAIPPGIETPEAFFSLFITPAHFELFAQYTNLNAQQKGAEEGTGRRRWHETTGSEIRVFLGTLLYQGECRLPATPDYWNTAIDKTISPSILNAISVQRWEQLKRFLKVSNPATDLDSSGPQWEECLCR